MSQDKQVRKRDRAATELKILEAALAEFLEHGRAGARIDRIANTAGVNKANIYHYFGSKDALLDALLSHQLTHVKDARSKSPDTFRDQLAYFQDQQIDDQEWIRLVTWEAVEYISGGEIAAEEVRTNAWLPIIEGLEAAMAAGHFPKMDARQFQLSLVALVTFPVVMPQFTKMITGLEWDSAAFRKQRKKFLREFADLITRPHDV